METLDIIFHFISFLFALLAATILILVNKEQHHNNRLLAIVLFILAITNINSAFIYNEWFLQFPRFHKLALPLTLLITPSSWLYIRSVLLGELKFRKYDWLLLIPPVLCIIDMMPYYTMPIEEKKAYLVEFYKNKSVQARFNEGFLPAYVFSFIRFAWSSVFIFFNFRLLKQFKLQITKQALPENKYLLRWLAILNGLLTVLLLASLIVAIIAPIKKTSLFALDFVLGASVMIICVQLFIRPKLLYGVYQPLSTIPVLPLNEEITIVKTGMVKSVTEKINETISAIETPVPELIISQTDSYRYKKTVETLFLEQKPFLFTDYTLEQLVVSTSIPRYVLSAFINKEYGMGFREFLNRYRVDYFKENLNNPDWKNLTLEAIAEQCGFSSRSTFIKNFKQISGQTPSEYVKKTNSQSLSEID